MARRPGSKSRYRWRSRSRSYRPSHKKRKRSISPMSSRKRHVGSRINPDSCRRLGVFGLSLYTTESELYQDFGKYGTLESCTVVLDKKTQTSRGFAFLTFQCCEDAGAAKEALDGADIDGRKIRVEYSITRRAHSPTPGIYMGRPGTLYLRRDGEYRCRRSPSPWRGPRYTTTPDRTEHRKAQRRSSKVERYNGESRRRTAKCPDLSPRRYHDSERYRELSSAPRRYSRSKERPKTRDIDLHRSEKLSTRRTNQPDDRQHREHMSQPFRTKGGDSKSSTRHGGMDNLYDTDINPELRELPTSDLDDLPEPIDPRNHPRTQSRQANRKSSAHGNTEKTPRESGSRERSPRGSRPRPRERSWSPFNTAQEEKRRVYMIDTPSKIHPGAK